MEVEFTGLLDTKEVNVKKIGRSVVLIQNKLYKIDKSRRSVVPLRDFHYSMKFIKIATSRTVSSASIAERSSIVSFGDFSSTSTCASS